LEDKIFAVKQIPHKDISHLEVLNASLLLNILPDKEFYFLKLFNNWLESAREDLMDMFSVHTVEEIVVRNMY